MKKTLDDRFWEKVDKRGDSECWTWLGYLNKDGYGKIRSGLRYRAATHVSWEIYNKKSFPVDKIACHSCDNPACVNPKHIWAGTYSENTVDAFKKGRQKNPTPWRDVTHCIRGHEFNEENTAIRGSIKKQRRCRVCERVAKRERYRTIKNLPKHLYRVPVVAICLLFVGCAAMAITDAPELSKRTLRINRDKAGFVYSYWSCVKKIVFCVKQELKTEQYDLTNPQVRNQLADMGFVAIVRDKPIP